MNAVCRFALAVAICGIVSAVRADDGAIRPSVEGLAAQVQELQRQVTALKAENAKLKTENETLRGAAKSSATTATAPAAKMTAETCQIAKGMSLAEVKKSCPAVWSLVSETNGVSRYTGKWEFDEVAGRTVIAALAEVAWVEIEDGKVTAYNIDRKKMKDFLIGRNPIPNPTK